MKNSDEANYEKSKRIREEEKEKKKSGINNEEMLETLKQKNA